MIEQAIRDYLTLDKSSAPIERLYYLSACEFLFDDDYVVEWGGADKTLKEWLELLDIELVWFRERILKLKDSKHRQINLKRLVINEEGEED